MSEAKTRANAPGGARERPVDKAYEGQKHPAMTPRDAATLILVRRTGGVPEVLLGCRDARHAFMPNRYVFPGGRVDRADAHVPVASALRPEVDAKLRLAASPTRARALAVAAIRETYEETGLLLAGPLAGKTPAAVDTCWAGFLDRGLAPALDLLDIVARAITPPGRPRRFNARFFIADASRATGEIKSNGELGDIRWVGLDEARQLPLPTITGLILGEVGRLLKEPPQVGAPRLIPLFKTLHGKHLLLEE
jgi:8-oxo-dGTP pyrophosphatase MutT (NUDIX family)